MASGFVHPLTPVLIVLALSAMMPQFLPAAGIMTPMIAAILMPVSSATVLCLAAVSLTGRRQARAERAMHSGLLVRN